MGVKDLGLLLSIAVYLESIAKYHPFVDGNKRTAIAAALRFLNLKSYKLRCS